MATEKRLIVADELIAEFEWLQSQVSTERAIDLKDHIQRIKDAKTVDAVEVVHGRWKAHKPDCRGYTAGFICSSCGNIVYTDYCMKECEYNYCPNCGAKMDGGEDNDHRTESGAGG